MIKVNGQEVKITRFPDNTFKFDLDIEKDLPFYSVEWMFESMEELFTLQSLKGFLNPQVWDLTMPYIPNARMDKTANDCEGFMLKYFADIINSLNFLIVWVDDPHSDVSNELIDSMVISLNDKEYEEVLDKYNPDMIVFPDEGARNRYTSLGLFDGYPIGHGIKERNQETGEIISFDVEGDFDGHKTALIIDDICSKGGTFFHTANKLREKGIEEVYLYVTFLEDTVKEGELWKNTSPVNDISALYKLGEW